MPVPTGTEAATVRVDPSGTVTAVFGIASHGQGLETTLAQVVADEVGVPLASVRVVNGDTALSPYGTGTYASRSTVLAGGAGILSGRDVREKTLRIAAHLLEAHPADLFVQDGRVTVRGLPDRYVTVRDVAKAAYGGVRHLPRGMEPGLEATRFYDPYYGTASNATHMAVVRWIAGRSTCGSCAISCRGLRQDHQPARGGRAGARGRGPGRGRGAPGRDGLRRRGPAPHRHADGLPGADRERGAGDGGAPRRDSLAARLPGHGRAGRSARR
jgi:hypothetical protein